MKNPILVALLVTAILSGCTPSPNKEVKNAEKTLAEAESDLKIAQEKENEAAKAKNLAEWRAFKHEADSTLAVMEEDLIRLEARIEKEGKTKQMLKTDYAKAKIDIAALKEKLNKRSMEFEEDMHHFDSNVYKKNQAFSREFNHDMDEFRKAFNDLFTDNSD
jgi:acetyl/propionyl-CoA carboxylase alpha subunit